MIRTENISYKIDGKYLVRNISVEFPDHKITLVSGPNGAGKSTLIHLLSGRYKPTEGKVLLGKVLLETVAQKNRAKICGVLSQNVALAFPMRVREVVAMGRYPHAAGHPTQKDNEICAEAMSFFDLTSLQDRNYLSLSGGEKQRVQFARVAAQIWPDDSVPETVKYLLLDEPLTHLDIHYQLQFMDHLCALMRRQPMTVVGVIHDLNLAMRYADRAVLLKGGEVVAAGDAESVYSPDLIEQVFTVRPEVVRDSAGNQRFIF